MGTHTPLRTRLLDRLCALLKKNHSQHPTTQNKECARCDERIEHCLSCKEPHSLCAYETAPYWFLISREDDCSDSDVTKFTWPFLWYVTETDRERAVCMCVWMRG